MKTSAKTFDSQATQQEKLRPFFQSQLRNIQFRVNLLNSLDIREKHTAMEDRKFKCGTCGKGFTSNAKLRDHTNIHTGEKPYKCKFCNACFASIGNHAMHQRSHLGHRRSK